MKQLEFRGFQRDTTNKKQLDFFIKSNGETFGEVCLISHKKKPRDYFEVAFYDKNQQSYHNPKTNVWFDNEQTDVYRYYYISYPNLIKLIRSGLVYNNMIDGQ